MPMKTLGSLSIWPWLPRLSKCHTKSASNEDWIGWKCNVHLTFATWRREHGSRYIPTEPVIKTRHEESEISQQKKTSSETATFWGHGMSWRSKAKQVKATPCASNEGVGVTASKLSSTVLFQVAGSLNGSGCSVADGLALTASESLDRRAEALDSGHLCIQENNFNSASKIQVTNSDSNSSCQRQNLYKLPPIPHNLLKLWSRTTPGPLAQQRSHEDLKDLEVFAQRGAGTGVEHPSATTNCQANKLRGSWAAAYVRQKKDWTHVEMEPMNLVKLTTKSR